MDNLAHTSGENDATPQTPIFHDTVVFQSRLHVQAEDENHIALQRTVSAGASPIRKSLVNLEQTSLENQRRQVLHDLMILAGEGVDLGSDHNHAAIVMTPNSPLRSPTQAATSALDQPNNNNKNSRRQLRATNCIASAYDTKCVLSSYRATDMSFASVPTRSATATRDGGDGGDDAEFGGLVYWVDKRKGTLGVLDLARKVRRTLLRGLKSPTHVQVVGNRVYWLESGSDWSFDGRVSFIDRTTERVHVLLSGLHYPRGFHVTSEGEENVYFCEVHRISDKENSNTWQVLWHINCLPGIHARNAVAGANFGLARLKRTVGIMENPRELADRITMYEDSGVERLESGTEEHVAVGHGEEIEDMFMSFAFPRDLVVVGTGSSAMIVVGVELYGVDRNATSLEIFGDNQGRTMVSSEEGGRENLHAMGGALLWMDVPALQSSIGKYPAPVKLLYEDVQDIEDPENFDTVSSSGSTSGVICILRMLVHRLGRVRNQPMADDMRRKVLTSVFVTNDAGFFANDRPFPRNQEDNDDYLLKYGCGLAVVHVPKHLSFDGMDAYGGARDGGYSYYMPLTSDSMQCVCVPSRSRISTSIQFTPFITMPCEERGLHLLHVDEDGADVKTMSHTFFTLCGTRADISQFSDPANERRKRREELTSYKEYVRPATHRSNGLTILDHETEETVVEGGEEEVEGVEEGHQEQQEQQEQQEGNEFELEVDLSTGTKETDEEKDRIVKDKEGNTKEGDGNGEEVKEESEEEKQKRDEVEEEEARLQQEAIERAKFASKMVPQHSSLRSLFASADADNEDDTASMQIKVVLRCRPLFDEERSSGSMDVVRCTMNDVTVLPPSNHHGDGDGDSSMKNQKERRQRFAFERVYGRTASQQELFEETVRPSICSAIEGYNVTVFAYGQTGTGKTYTMEGHMEDTERAGIIPRSVYSVFDVLESTCAPGDYEVKVSHLEIYQEILHDLLSPHNAAESLTARLSKRKHTTSLALAMAMQRKGIQMKYDPNANQAMAIDAMRNGRLIGPMADVLRARIMKARLEEVEQEKKTKLSITSDDDKGVFVKNLTERIVKTPEEIFQVLQHSIAKRVTAETMCNGQSSRSHSIFTLTIHIKERDRNNRLTGNTRIGRLNLVDLSGSENRKRAGGPGDGVRQRESSAINQGLLSLGRVIKARTEGDEHVPFRDSKLTRILEESLGGNCITTLILTISPNHKEVGETLSTLNYAHKAKVIENRPTKYIREDSVPSAEEGSDTDNDSYHDENGENGDRRRKRGKNSAAENDAFYGVGGMRRTTIMPWSGRVPVRRVSSSSSSSKGTKNNLASVPRQVIGVGEGRMLHAPSVDWVRTNLLNSTPDNPFVADPATNEAKNFGFTSSRSAHQASMASTTLSGSAQSALREVFRRFDREHLKKLQNYLNSPSGALLNRTTQGFGGHSGDSARPFGPINEGIFLQLFAAAGTLDPIRAAFVVSKLGYRPNFSVESPKTNTSSKYSRTSSNSTVGIAAKMKKNSNNRSSNRPSAPSSSSSKNKHGGGRRPASAGSTRRRRPASAGISRGAKGKKKNTNGRQKRPSTAGNRRGSKTIDSAHSNNSSFLRGAITPRHRRGPMDFYFKFLSGVGSQLVKKK